MSEMLIETIKTFAIVIIGLSTIVFCWTQEEANASQ